MSFDPSVKSGHSDFVKENFDFSKLTLDDKTKPTVFTIKPLTRRQKMVCDNMNGANLKWSIVQFGLVSVDDYEWEGVTGQKVQLPPVKFSDSGADGFGKFIDDKWLDEANFTQDELDELISAIIKVGEARPL